MNSAPDAAATSIRVADDDRAYLGSLRELIDQQPELEVVATAVDGVQAIELAEQLEPDAVVLDVHMPLLDGVSAAARLRHDHPSICLIALTGDDAPALHRAVLEAGADEVLLKSTILDALLERLTGVRARPEG